MVVLEVASDQPIVLRSEPHEVEGERTLFYLRPQQFLSGAAEVVDSLAGEGDQKVPVGEVTLLFFRNKLDIEREEESVERRCDF